MTNSSITPWKIDFPCLNQMVNHKPLVFLDSAASAQKPQYVINREKEYYERYNANIHRGVYMLANKSTELYEEARERVRSFINAKLLTEIIFTKGTTESINLLADSLGESLTSGDEILLTLMEHHSNIVPWVRLAEKKNLKIKVVPLNKKGELDLSEAKALMTEKTKVFAFTHISNVTGAINPIQKLVSLAKEHDIITVIDGAQGVVHETVDVQALNCDFYAFSGHKLYGPTGIGVLYGKQSQLEKIPPYQSGGSMIESVTFEKVTYAPCPQKFEAGTPNIAGAIGLHAAIDYVTSHDFHKIIAHEKHLTKRLKKQLDSIKGVHLLGSPSNHASVFSFTLDNVHAHDLATFLDTEGIAVRAGHHCCMPLMAHYGVTATTRASLGLYNSEEDITALCIALEKAKEFFA